MFPIKIKQKAEKVFKLCLKKKVKLTFAESCTGGLLSSLITSFPNSSKIFISSFVTYSNLSKQKMLGVKNKTLKKTYQLTNILPIKFPFESKSEKSGKLGKKERKLEKSRNFPELQRIAIT